MYAPTSSCPKKCTLLSSTLFVRGLAISCNNALQRVTNRGDERSTTRNTCTYTSFEETVRVGCWLTPRSSNTSGTIHCIKPNSTSRSSPFAGWGETSSLFISSRIRSRLIFCNLSACRIIERRVSASIVKSNCAAKRTARSKRNGSSSKRLSGSSPTARKICTSKSCRPPNRSIICPLSGSRAIALIVKSRRSRSSSNFVPKHTSGLRDSGLYCSLRNVVISMISDP